MRKLCVGLLALMSLTTGCDLGAYFTRAAVSPMLALQSRADPHVRAECLVVFLPGVLDGPDHFVEQGFFRAARRASSRCDLVAPGAHLGYYREGRIRQAVTGDIRHVAEARGYREIWLVGISMGGLGALLTAEVNPERIAGVVLLAPHLGDPAIPRAIQREGGLAEWDAPRDADLYDFDEYDDALWAWLQGYAREPDERPPLYIALGDADERLGVNLLESVLPEGRVGHAPGGHSWTVWRPLFERLMRSPPGDPGFAEPGWGRGPDAGGEG